MRVVHSIQGERWDQLSMRVYGICTEEAVLNLRHANPDLTRDARFTRPFLLPQGHPVNVPELPFSALQQDEIVEPAPWQR